jgi:hypothetical protein
MTTWLVLQPVFLTFSVPNYRQLLTAANFNRSRLIYPTDNQAFGPHPQFIHMQPGQQGQHLSLFCFSATGCEAGMTRIFIGTGMLLGAGWVDQGRSDLPPAGVLRYE